MFSINIAPLIFKPAHLLSATAFSFFGLSSCMSKNTQLDKSSLALAWPQSLLYHIYGVASSPYRIIGWSLRFVFPWSDNDTASQLVGEARQFECGIVLKR